MDHRAQSDRLCSLERAIFSGNKKIVGLLLDRSASVNNVDSLGYFPLHLAVRYNNVEMAALLLAHGAQVDAQQGSIVRLDSNKRRTLLHIAAALKYRDMTVYLLKAGANMNIQDHDRRTPLHLAALHWATDIVVELLNHNADVNALDNHSQTPLCLTIVKLIQPRSGLRGINGALVAKSLLAKGANPNVKYGKTYVLHEVTRFGAFLYVKTLVKGAVDVNVSSATKAGP